MYRPSSADTAELPEGDASSWTPATPAPCASVTRPTIRPDDCATAQRAGTIAIATTRTARVMMNRNMANLLGCGPATTTWGKQSSRSGPAVQLHQAFITTWMSGSIVASAPARVAHETAKNTSSEHTSAMAETLTPAGSE